MSNRRVTATHFKAYLLLALALLCLVAGVFFFANGFLLTRSELTNVSPPSTSVSPPRFNRTIMLLVDGLYSGLLPNASNPASHFNQLMPYLTELLREKQHKSRTYLSHFLADPPTTTMQRLKALLTGSMPTFIDAGANFGGTELQEDNIIKQWALAGRRMCFVGDQVWSELVPDGFFEMFPLPAFNIKDLDTVDIAVKKYVLKEMSATDATVKCEILIGHMLGIDHCGHTYGRVHPEMDRKLRELDKFLGQIIPKLRSNDLLVVFGDHGMTLSGDHGGESEAELDAAVLFYTSLGFPLLHTTPDDSADGDLPSMEQVDLVPTLAALTGIPPPYSNLGVVEPRLFATASQLRLAVAANFRQLTTYALEYQKLFSLISFPDDLENKLVFSENLCANTTTCLADMKQLRSIFRSHWTRMDTHRIFLGFLLFNTGIISFLFFDASPLQHPPINVSLVIAICVIGLAIPGTILFTGGIVAFFVVISVVDCVIIFPPMFKSIHLSFSEFLPFSILLLFALLSTSNSFVVQEARVIAFLIQSLLAMCILRSGRGVGMNTSTVCLVAAMIFVYAAMRMEVCREESPLSSMCRSPQSLWVQSMASLTLPTRGELSVALGKRLIFSGSMLTACIGLHRFLLNRAGNLLESGVVGLTLRWLPLLFGLPLFSVWLLEACIADTISASTKDVTSAGKMALLSFLRLNAARVVMLACGLVIFLLLHSPLLVSALATVNPSHPRPIKRVAKQSMTKNSHGLPNPKEYLAALLSQTADLETKQGTTEIFLSGLGTVYSAWLATTLGLCPIVFLSLLVGDAHICGLVGMVCCLLIAPIHLLASRADDDFGVLSTKKDKNDRVRYLLETASSWSCAIYACLLGQLGFFITGHQTTLSTIPWEAAFSVFQGDHSTYVFPAALVLSHTFAAQLLTTLCLPLMLTMSFHSQQRTVKKKERLSELHLFHCDESALLFTASLDRLLRRFFIAQLIVSSGHLLCAFVLRRHLMVWKIFAPRLVFSFSGLIVISLTALFVRFLVISRLHACLVQLRKDLATA